MSFWFEYVESQIDVPTLKKIATMEDEAIKYFMSAWICEIAGGVELPTKAHITALAERMILKGYTKQEVLSKTGIGKSQYYEIRKKHE